MSELECRGPGPSQAPQAGAPAAHDALVEGAARAGDGSIARAEPLTRARARRGTKSIFTARTLARDEQCQDGSEFERWPTPAELERPLPSVEFAAVNDSNGSVPRVRRGRKRSYNRTRHQGPLPGLIAASRFRPPAAVGEPQLSGTVLSKTCAVNPKASRDSWSCLSYRGSRQSPSSISEATQGSSEG